MMEISAYAIPGIQGKSPLVNPETIEKVVGDYYFISIAEMRKTSRRRDRVTCRHIISWLIRKHTNLSLKCIADFYGKDHTTAIHSIRTANNLIETDDRIREDVRKIEKRITAIYNL